MAEVEEPRFTTLAERIAALNAQKNFQAPLSPSATVGKRAPPPPPPVRAATTEVLIKTISDATPPARSPSIPARPVRAATERGPPPLPRRTTDRENGELLSAPPGRSPVRPPPPPLPARSSGEPTPPRLPSRQPSRQTLNVRRNSNASEISQLSTVSTLSLNHTRSHGAGGPESHAPRRLPPPLEDANLPPLPPTRREIEAKAKEAANATPSLPPRRTTEPPRPSLPPRLPSRPVKPPAIVLDEEPPPALPVRRLPPPASNFRAKSALASGFGSGAPKSPPPIPLSSRPTLAQIDAAASRISLPSPTPPPTNNCLTCRDFSAPDALAAQHPTASLPPRTDPIAHLARTLCDPFPSATDKARAIFTWLHHNIVYDVHGFFNNCIPRGQTPAQTIASGKAVCEGYARVYESIAARAGLGCVVVCGHGKGYGFTPLRAGEPPPPPDPTGHAWNAVRIDGGVWKLVDPCWGAGALCNGAYTQRLASECFTMSNEQFGTRHFPEDPRHWYGPRKTWREYVVGPVGDEPAEWMGDATTEGLDVFNFEPARKKISVYGGGVVRFQFGKVCEHWLPERHGEGKQMLFGLKIGGLDGRKEDIVPVEHDGFWYYVDVDARDLGAPGQKVSLIGFQTVDGQSARGLTKAEWLRKKGRSGYSYAHLVRWELV
ncbi:hypothetical protein BT67DRAFT_446127 [Trichocladium antarcticum]|uniref:Transglutaminase-like domain-containing protein n=1 Tax=Trichocladium antarcticum TaxID=1450529 RepID=A0AAN6UBL5_9PEZI|nr:hypothetical protein BT67DRAFT_446127 [Trichocladium antarcticum]